MNPNAHEEHQKLIETAETDQTTTDHEAGPIPPDYSLQDPPTDNIPMSALDPKVFQSNVEAFNEDMEKADEPPPATLTKVMTVMKLSDDRYSSQAVLFEPEEVEEGEVVPGYLMTYQVWNDMGQPDTVTVTVRPGDRLN